MRPHGTHELRGGQTIGDGHGEGDTPGDLLAKELETMGILDKGRQAGGGGTVPPAGGSGTTIDITGAKTRVEAYEAIAANLMAQGLTAGSEKFDAAMKQAWQDNNIAALPEK